MKKIIGILLLLLIFASGFYYVKNYTGQDLYTKITTDGSKSSNKDDQGNEVIFYQYTLQAADKKGDEKQVTFNGTSGRNIRKGAYLKLKYNNKKGVLSWEEVTEKEIPKAALEKIN